MAPGEGALRLTRTAVFAVSAVGLASAAHFVADGDVPLIAAGLSVPLVMLLIHLLAAGRRGPASLFLGMGLTQVGLHLTFMATSIGAACGTAGSAASGSVVAGATVSGSVVSGYGGSAGSLRPDASMAGMSMSGAHGHVVTSCDAALGHTDVAAVLPSISMLIGHLLATVIVVTVLSRGEAAVWALAANLRFRFDLPRVAVLLPAVRRLPVTPAARRRPTPTVHLRSIRRRGPPSVACVPA